MRARMAGAALAAAGTIAAMGTASSPAQEPTTTTATQPAGLPDLVMQPITEIKPYAWLTKRGKKVKRRWAVRFSSIVQNNGPGHFVIHAHRSHTGKPCKPNDPGVSGIHRCEKVKMTGDQLIVNADGTTTTVPKVAVVFFDEYHFHWHLRGANRYELRTRKGKLLSRDRKTGFCFGDRIAAVQPAGVEYSGLEDGLATCLYGSTAEPAKDGRRALELTEGISAGYADDYRSFHKGAPLEGQELEVTKLKKGLYQLINRTNATGRFREVTRANDGTSVLLKLSWPKGHRHKPKIKVVRRCPGKSRCAPPKKKKA